MDCVGSECWLCGIRVVLLGDHGVGKVDLYRWLLGRSENVNEEVAVPVAPTHGSAPQLKPADRVQPISHHASAQFTHRSPKRSKSVLSNHPCQRHFEKAKQLLWLPSNEYEDYTYGGHPGEPSSSGSKGLSNHTKPKFLRFSGVWKVRGRIFISIFLIYFVQFQAGASIVFVAVYLSIAALFPISRSCFSPSIAFDMFVNQGTGIVYPKLSAFNLLPKGTE